MRSTRESGASRFKPVRDRERLVNLGVAPHKVTVTGNLKYESPTPNRNEALAAALRHLAGSRPMILAGSTMEGEDEQLLDALSLLKSSSPETTPLLVMAPRHPERWPAVAELVVSRGFNLTRRSELRLDESTGVTDLPNPGDSARSADVVLLDSSASSRASTPRQRSPSSAAPWWRPVVTTRSSRPAMPSRRWSGRRWRTFGKWPSTSIARTPGVRVASSSELASTWARLLEDSTERAALGQRALRLLEENRGASERTLTWLRDALAGHQDTTVPFREPRFAPRRLRQPKRSTSSKLAIVDGGSDSTPAHTG